MDCIFCKIAANQMPCYKLGETEKSVAFLDITPCTRGHAVVVPKRHAHNILELSSEGIGDIFSLVRDTTQLIQNKLNVDSFNIGINHGPASNNSIEHLHIHIIPRRPNDGGGSMHTIIRKAQEEEVEKTYQTITK